MAKSLFLFIMFARQTVLIETIDFRLKNVPFKRSFHKNILFYYLFFNKNKGKEF